MIDIKEYESLIKRVISKVPDYIREDCYQAACIGLLKALERKDSARSFRRYAYQCMKSEVLKEVALLDGCVKGIFSVEKSAFLKYCKYKKKKHQDIDTSDMELSANTEKCFKRLMKAHRISDEYIT